MKQYVNKSIADDLSNIEVFYSTSGAGHGSAFWVAELVEPAPATSAPVAAQLSPRPSRNASATGLQRQAASETPNTPARPLAPAETPPAPATAVTIAAPPSTGIAAAAERGDNNGVATVSAGSSESESGKAGESRSSAASGSDDDESRQTRALVAGLVAAAVARFEGAAPPSRPPSPPSPAKALPSLACVEDANEPGDQAHEAPQPGFKAPAVAPTPAVPSPGTPAVAVKRPRIGSFVQPAAAAPASPAAEPAPEAAAVTAAAAAVLAPVVGRRRPTIVGHVALERKTWKQAELRRMSVMEQYGGHGIGGRLLEALVQHARDVGFRELVLHTSGMQPAARRLYERGGWSVSKVSRVQGMAIYTYTLDLTKKRS